MTNYQLASWLFKNSNPVIQYLLIMNHGIKEDRQHYQEILLKDQTAKYWIDNTIKAIDLLKIHDSFDYCYENSMGKLIQFGIGREGYGAIDPENRLLDKLAEAVQSGRKIFRYHYADNNIVAACLAAAGYHNDKTIASCTQNRLDEINEFIRQFGYNIYVSKNGFKGIPEAFETYPLVNPEITNENFNRLPRIYDLVLFQSILEKDSVLNTEENRIKLEKLFRYIFNPEYQNMPVGYGICIDTGNKYYKIGWNILLPSLLPDNTCSGKAGLILLYAELFSRFPYSRESEWFPQALALLESFKTSSGTYLFPKEFLPEKKNSYLVLGNHMGLGENRRRPEWAEIESTCWMLKIKENLSRMTPG